MIYHFPPIYLNLQAILELFSNYNLINSIPNLLGLNTFSELG